MPFVTLITSPDLQPLELDATVTASHQAEIEVTDHPVEEGANITDHARAKPLVLTLEGVISSTPLNASQTDRVIQNLGGGFVGHAEDGYQRLETIRTTRQLLKIATELRTYNNMMMTQLNVPRDGKTGDALRFTATFKEVRLAEIRRKEVTVQTKDPKGKDKQKLGKQVAAETKPEYTSAATEVFDNFGVLNKERGRNVVKLAPEIKKSTTTPGLAEGVF